MDDVYLASGVSVVGIFDGPGIHKVSDEGGSTLLLL